MTNKVLIVEDDRISVRLTELILKREKFETVIAKNGLRGLQLARAESPDVILLDLMLPGIDGFEVLNQLRSISRTAKIPVIVVSAKSKSTDKDRAKQLGANAYLIKPYKSNELFEVIRSVLPEKSSKKAAQGICIGLVGPRPAQVSAVVTYTGLALAKQGQSVTAIDLHPYAIEHSLLLNLIPSSSPLMLGEPATLSRLKELTTKHASGLKLLNNLVGTDNMEQITRDDLHAVVTPFLEDGQILLLDLPSRPPQLLKQLAAENVLTLIVAEARTAALAATRTMIDLLTQIPIPAERIAFVLISSNEESKTTTLDLSILATLPQNFNAASPALQTLASRVQAHLISEHQDIVNE